MPKRNDTGFEERQQQILTGALHAFAEKGYTQTTNRDIARAAGIGSPGLIYHYFKDKSSLLRAVLEQHATLLQLLSHETEFHALPPPVALLQAGRAYLEMMQTPEVAAFVRVLVGEAIRQPALAQTFIEVGPRRGLELLARYLKSHMDAGALRQVDPDLAARSFMGPLVLAKIAQALLPQPNMLAVDAEALLLTHIEIFLRGLAPDIKGGIEQARASTSSENGGAPQS